jgi:rare lipoprotein A
VIRRGLVALWCVGALIAGALLAGCSPTSAIAGAVAGRAQPPSEGLASWYGPGFAGRLTANGEIFDPSAMTAAHRSLPFDSRVRVTNLNNGSSVVVRINDRGPFVAGRVIDLSRASAELLGMMGSGVAPVRLDLLDVDTTVTEVGRADWLVDFEVVSTDHPVGALLLITSAQVGERLVVRVVDTQPPPTFGQSLLLSATLYDLLGGEVVILAQ